MSFADQIWQSHVLANRVHADAGLEHITNFAYQSPSGRPP
jgi:hypothetical protein